MTVDVLKPGMLSTIQDLGRVGYQRAGIIVSGAMDHYALKVANLLVGNKLTEAALEMTLIGPSLRFNHDAIISICGADLNPTIDGQPVPRWRTIGIRKGALLTFQSCKSGCRAYLAIAGGFDIKKVLGSYSTYLLAGIGGISGRALKANDAIELKSPHKIFKQLELNKESAFTLYPWNLTHSVIPKYQSPFKIRVLEGAQYDWFTQKSIDFFFNQRYQISPQSDRMGYRLKGPMLSLKENKSMISEAVSFGSVQVPANGQPIILLADRQTIGGYPKIAQVATVDLPLMAQAKSSNYIHFKKVNLQQAQSLLIKQERTLQLLKQAINLQN